MLKKCKYCGTLNLDNAVNCSNCNKSLVDSPIQQNLESFSSSPEENKDKQIDEPTVVNSESKSEFTPQENKNDDEINFSNCSTGKNRTTDQKNKNEFFDSEDSPKNEPKINLKPVSNDLKQKSSFNFTPLSWKKSAVAGVVLGLMLVCVMPGCFKDSSSSAVYSSTSEVEPTASATATAKSTSVPQSTSDSDESDLEFHHPTSIDEIPDKLKTELYSEFNDYYADFVNNPDSGLDRYSVESEGIVGEWLKIPKKSASDFYTSQYGVLIKFKITGNTGRAEGVTGEIYRAVYITNLNVKGDKYEEYDINDITQAITGNSIFPLGDSTGFSSAFESIDDFKTTILEASKKNYTYEYKDVSDKG